ncbi:MAG TPA: hypothetical protein VEB18_01290 [Candidatus Paceibacterota bacterium]|nr:hypothetical protein [Candidatus Paceibacterota bacterium]
MTFAEMPPIPGKKFAPGKTGQLERLDAKRRLTKAKRWVKSGWENVVTRIPNKADIYAYSFRTPDEGFRAREIYYIHRILKVLFPSHFPRIRAAMEHRNNSETPGGTVRQEVKIKEDPLADSRKASFVYWFMQNFVTKTTEGDFQEVRQALQDMGIKSGIDFNPANFAADEEGHEQYLDTAPGLAEPFINQHPRIIEYMWARGYAGDDVRKVEKALKRLDTLVARRKKRLTR